MDLSAVVLPAFCNTAFVFIEFALSPLIVTVLEGDTSKILILSSILYIASIVGYVCMAWFSRKFGLKIALLTVMLLNIIASIIAVAGIGNVNLIIAGRTISGFAIVSLLTQTWMNFVHGDESAIASQAIYNFTFYFGAVLGVCVAGISSEFIGKSNAWSMVNAIAIAFLVIGTIACAIVHDPAPEHCKYKMENPEWFKRFIIKSTIVKKNPSVRELNFRAGTAKFKFRSLVAFVCCEMTVGISEGVFYTAFSVQLSEQFHFTDIQISYVYIGIIMVAMISNVLIVPRIKMRNMWLIILTGLYIIIAIWSSILATVITVMTMIKALEQIIFSTIRAREYAEIPEAKRFTFMVLPMSIFQGGCVVGIIAGIDIMRKYSSELMYGFVAIAYAIAFAVVLVERTKW